MVLYRIVGPETREDYWDIRELKAAVGKYPFTKNEFIYNYTDAFKVTAEQARQSFEANLSMGLIEFYQEVPDRPKRPGTRKGG